MAASGWSESVRLTATIVLLLALLGLGLAVSPVLPAISIAALLAYLLDPLVRWQMRRTGASRPTAARLTYFFFVLLLVNVPAWLGALVVSQIDALEALVQDWATRLHDWLARPVTILSFRLEPEYLLNAVEDGLRRAVESVPQESLTLLGNVTTNLLWTIVILVLLYYMLKDGPLIKEWLVRLAPPGERATIAKLVDEIDTIWSRFLRVQIVMFAVMTIAIGLGSWLVIWIWQRGIFGSSPLVLVIGLAIVYTVLQQIDNLWLRPQFLGRSLQLHPGIVFVGLFAGLIVAGVLGALFAVPIIASARVIAGYLQALLRGSPTPPPVPAPTSAD
jgi:putative heme transporter